MIELSRSQDENVGDGTTSVVILGSRTKKKIYKQKMIAIQQTKYIAGEMLIVSVPYLEKKIHPTVIIRGMQRALEDIVAHYQSEFFVMFVSVIYNIKFHLYLYSVRRNFVHS